MHDPIAAGRRSALRAVSVQAIASVLVAAAFLPWGLSAVIAAGVGGGALVLGNAVAAMLSLNGIVRARVAFARLLLGTLAKWCVATAILVVALEVWRLPPLPVLVGLAAGLLAYLLAMAVSGKDFGFGRQVAGRSETKG